MYENIVKIISMENPHKEFSYYETSKHLKKLFRQLYTYKAKLKKDNIQYKGEDIKSCSILATSFNISESFRQRNIEYDKEQGRDSLDVFINKVFQLGYSVGYENSKDDNSFMISFAQETLENMKKIENTELNPELKDKIKKLWEELN